MPEVWRYVFASFFAITAVFHAVGIVVAVNEASPLRHALFLAINAVCVWGFCVRERPRWFAWAFVALTLQQLWSHGSDVVARWPDVSAVDVGVVLAMPAVATWLLLSERRREYDKTDQRQ